MPQPQPTRALQDHVDKMRIRLKSLAYSLDPSGPVPEIIIPDRSGRSKRDDKKSYTLPGTQHHLACVEFAGNTPMWKRQSRARAQLFDEDPHYLATMAKEVSKAPSKDLAPEKMLIKDRLSMKIHQHFSDTLPAGPVPNCSTK